MTSGRLTPHLRDRLVDALVGSGWRRVQLIRRIAAATLAVVALVLALVPQSSTDGVPLVVAAADLRAGVTVSADDLAVREWPAELVPAGAARDPTVVAGRVLVGAARAGEPLTDVRLVGTTGSAGPDGAAVPIRLADGGVAGLLTPGGRVDVVTIGERADQPAVLAADAVVLAVLEPEPGARGRLVMVAMPREVATRVAAASLADQVAVTLR